MIKQFTYNSSSQRFPFTYEPLKLLLDWHEAMRRVQHELASGNHILIENKSPAESPAAPGDDRPEPGNTN